MKRYEKIHCFALAIFFLLINSNLLLASKITDKHFVIITASYNNARWYKQNLDSVLSQTYKNWHMIYTDDCSTDGTADLVEEYIKKHDHNKQITLIRNKERKMSLHNIVHSIYLCKDNSHIAVSLDGDDMLAHNRVLERLNGIYKSPNVWMTFGSFCLASTGKKDPWLHAYSENIKAKRAYRSYDTMMPSHLRTFYIGLFKKINLEDLKYEGKFFEMAGDVAFMIPIIEMAHEHHVYIDEVLYVYNNVSNINDNKVDAVKQRFLDRIIRTRPKYPALNTKPY